jgi:hypothetical protein
MTTIKQTQSINLVPYKKSLSIIEVKANQLSIKTDAEISTASDILFQIGEVQRKFTAEKEKLTNPAKSIIKWARDTFGPIEKQCEAAEATIKGKMVAYDAKKQAEAVKKLAKIAEKVTEGKIDLETASEKIDNLKPVNSYEGENGSIQFRQQKVITIIDEAKIPRKYMEPNMVAIRAGISAGDNIPGVEVKIEKIVAKGRI